MNVTPFTDENICGTFRLQKLLSNTSRTQVWEVTDFENRKFAAKLVLRNLDCKGRKPFLSEFKAYVALSNGRLKYDRESNGATPVWFPNIRYTGRHMNYDVLVMELLPEDAFSLRNERPWADNFSTSSYQSIACHMLAALMVLHEQGFVHRNVKPQNFRMNGRLVYLVDFSNAKRYVREKTNVHYKSRKESQFTGTLKYASLSAHLLNVLSRKDDLISLGYSIIDMIKKGLPWDTNFTSQHTFQYQDKYIRHMKAHIPLIHLCHSLPEGILQYMQTVTALPFDATPDYRSLKDMLAPEI